VTTQFSDRSAASTLPARDLILASASPRRQALLREFGLVYRIVPPAGFDENLDERRPEVLVEHLAEGKAAWSRRRALATGDVTAATWVLGADTVVVFEGEVLGKPDDTKHAAQMLARLAGRTHEVHSGVAVLRPDGTSTRGVVASRVTFKDLGRDAIARYVATGDPLGKAGAYGIQSEGRTLVAGFEGCYYNIVGLPVRLTFQLLELPLPACDCARHALQRGAPAQVGCER
jgi:septum formation protein